MAKQMWRKRLERLMIMFGALGFSTQKFLPKWVYLSLYVCGALSFVGWLCVPLFFPPAK